MKYEFSNFLFDSNSRLWCDGAELDISEYQAKVLRRLLESRPGLVLKEDLLTLDGEQYGDANLRKAISRLREVLGDNGGSPQFIKNKPRKGYTWLFENVIETTDADEIADLDLEISGENTNESRLRVFPSVKNITKREQIENLINDSLKNAEKSKNYHETIDLLNTFQNSYSAVLSTEQISELALKKAILFQKTGDIVKANGSLHLFENTTSNFENNLDYILCKGKIISQSHGNPKFLEEFVQGIETKELLKASDSRQALASFYWRLTIMFSCEDNKQSKNYFSKHRELAEVGSYQFAHNIQCEAITNIKTIKNDTKISNKLLSAIPELLLESYKKYTELNNFAYLDKCLVSNLLLMATFDRMSDHIINYYRKIFFVRKIFSRMHIKHNDEGMAEILTVIRKLFPDMYELLFLRSISSLINTGKNNSFIKEIYLEVELEFERIFMSDSSSYVTTIYKTLIL